MVFENILERIKAVGSALTEPSSNMIINTVGALTTSSFFVGNLLNAINNSPAIFSDPAFTIGTAIAGGLTAMSATAFAQNMSREAAILHKTAAKNEQQPSPNF